MTLYKACTPDVQVNGDTILSTVAGSGDEDQVRQILTECGIVDPAAGEWYPQQAWLDAFKRINDEVGPRTLFGMGKALPVRSHWPPASSIETALPAIDVQYHANHRGGDIGSYKYESTGKKKARIIASNPYPCDFDLGIITSVATRYKPASSQYITTRHDDARPCRLHGAETCTYLVEW
jgi:hypothetical protein